MIGLKKKMQKVYDEDDNLELKATPKEHSPFTLDNSLVTTLIFKANIPPTNGGEFKDSLRITKITTLINHQTNLINLYSLRSIL